MSLRYFLNDGCLQKKPTDQQYDDLVRSMVTEKKLANPQTALDKLGVDESEVTEVKPLFLEGFVFGDKDSYAKIGKDGKWRSSKYQVSWIF